MKSSPHLGMPVERITEKIDLTCGHRVMLDQDLASLYQVETKALKQAVKSNIERFPGDFMFELSREEFDHLRSQIVTSSRGGFRYAPIRLWKNKYQAVSQGARRLGKRSIFNNM